MESRHRELTLQRRKKRIARRRRILLGCCTAGILVLGAGVWLLKSRGTFETVETVTETVQAASVTETAAASGRAGSEEQVNLKEELPVRFDLREYGTAPEVPDQGTFGTCWAFASLGALESSMPEELRLRLSADHMSLRNSFGLGQDAGGDYSMSTSYLLAWQGPVAEADDPYGDGESPEDADPVCHLQEIQILPAKDLEAIKRAVYETGGVQSSFYMPQTAGEERDRYFNDETDAFYYDGSLEANHDVVIVGWEDHYPKENFVKEPLADGAFLCMNTWGESFGDRGFFYISYEDSRIGTNNVSYTRVEAPDNYDAVYQSDLCGWIGQLGYGMSKAWFANVYEAAEDSLIQAAGFYATTEKTSYRLYTVVLERDLWQQEQDGSISGMRVREALAKRSLAAEGQFLYSGYYTVDLAEPIELKAGERFAVIAEIDSPGSKEPVAVEYVAGERTRNVDLSDGEGYISPDGVNWQRAETAQGCNICLKAYARKN